MIDGGGGDNWTYTGAISRAKLQSNHHHQQTNIQFLLQVGCPSYRPTNSVKSLTGKMSHSMYLLTPSSPGAFQLCLWPLIAPGFLGGRLPCLSSALWCQYPGYNVSNPYNYFDMKMSKLTENVIILPWSIIRILSVVSNKISDALTRSCFYRVYNIDVDIRQQECDLLKWVFVHFCRLLDELNISSKTGMLFFQC